MNNIPNKINKFPYCSHRLLLQVNKAKKEGKGASIRVFNRSIHIIPEFVNMTFGVYNGKSFSKVTVTQNHVGHRFGEFSPTRTITKQTAQRLGFKVKK